MRFKIVSFMIVFAALMSVGMQAYAMLPIRYTDLMVTVLPSDSCAPDEVLVRLPEWSLEEASPEWDRLNEEMASLDLIDKCIAYSAAGRPEAEEKAFLGFLNGRPYVSIERQEADR